MGIIQYEIYNNSRYDVGIIFSPSLNSWSHLDDFQIRILLMKSNIFVNENFRWTISTMHINSYYENGTSFLLNQEMGRNGITLLRRRNFCFHVLSRFAVKWPLYVL